MVLHVMQIENIKFLKNSLALHTYPVGIRFSNDLNEIPEKARRPYRDFKQKWAVCQAINISRYYGFTVGYTLEDAYCMVGAAVFNLLEKPEYIVEAGLEYPFHARSLNEGRKLFERVLGRILKTNIKAIIITSLLNPLVDPQIIVIYGSPIQIGKIIKAVTYYGETVRSEFIGVSSCSAIPLAYNEDRMTFVIPCAGERILGGTEENEIWIAFPAGLLDKIIEGLKGIEWIYPYPMRPLIYEPMVPKKYRITYKDYQEWLKRSTN
ncbi:MAG: DUF169 domain-containing protein [Candidatus Methanomethylicia archaeon]